MLLGGSRWSEAACAAVARFAERFALPVATTFRRAHLFDPTHPCYAGDLGIGPNPEAARAREERRRHRARRRTAAARCRRRATRCSTFRGRARRSCTSFPASRSSAASTGRISPSMPRRPPSPPRSKGSSRRTSCGGAVKRRSRMRFSRLDRQADGGARRGQSRRDRRRLARHASRRCGDLQRRRQFLGLGAPLLALPRATAPSSRRSPARWATACRRRSA